MRTVRPIFILSLPRSGSTLLQRLLMADGRCASFGEPSLLLRFLGQGDVMARRATYGEMLVETAMGDIRDRWSGFDETYRRGVRDLMLSVYDGLAEGKPWFLDKTPRYSLIAEELMQTFPDAKFIVLWRHPLAVAASMASTFGKGWWNPDEFAIDLHEGLDRLLRFCNAHAEKVFQMRYEDLVVDTAEVLEGLGNFLGWDGLPQVVERELVSSAGGSLGDPTGVTQYRSVSTQSREAWKGRMNNWFRRSWANRYFSGSRADQMRALGYEWPEELARKAWWRDGVWAGIVEWAKIRRRLQRYSRSPIWQVRFARKFRLEHGYDIVFR
jgi:hypothetical protein